MDKNQKLDPEMLDVILMVLSGISQIATLGIAWKSYSLQRTEHHQTYQRAQLRHTVIELERAFETLFTSLDEIMQLFSVIQHRNPTYITGHEMRFGRSSMFLNNEDYSAFNNNMSSLQNACFQIRAHSGNLIRTLAHMRVAGENSINDFLEDFNDNLNDILFESATVDEAASKIKSLRPRIKHFLDHIKNLGN